MLKLTLAPTPFNGSLDDLFADLEARQRGVAFFLYKIPENHHKWTFPAPELTPLLDGYVDFSETHPSLVNAKVFNPQHHLFRLTDTAALLCGVIGPTPHLWEYWAPGWVRAVSRNPLYYQWVKKMVWFPHSELQENRTETNPTPLTQAPIAQPRANDPLGLKESLAAPAESDDALLESIEKLN